MAEQPETQRCENCRFFREEDEEHFGACVRYPADLEPNIGERENVWPVSAAEGWCGEWQPANPETAEEAAVVLARFVLLGDITAARALADKLKE